MLAKAKYATGASDVALFLVLCVPTLNLCSVWKTLKFLRQEEVCLFLPAVVSAAAAVAGVHLFEI